MPFFYIYTYWLYCDGNVGVDNPLSLMPFFIFRQNVPLPNDYVENM